MQGDKGISKENEISGTPSDNLRVTESKGNKELENIIVPLATVSQLKNLTIENAYMDEIEMPYRNDEKSDECDKIYKKECESGDVDNIADGDLKDDIVVLPPETTSEMGEGCEITNGLSEADVSTISYLYGSTGNTDVCKSYSDSQKRDTSFSNENISSAECSVDDLKSNITQSSSDDLKSNNTQSSFDEPKSKNTEGKEQGIRKGRFVIETAHLKNPTSLSTVQFQRGRFHVTQAGGDEERLKKKLKKAVNIIGLQNKQIDLLFDMVKNISGDDKLFQREFNFIANEVYEKIENLKKSISE